MKKQEAQQRAEKFRNLRLNGATFEDIASTYSISRQRVEQIISQYERTYNLPRSTATKREVVKFARQADKEEYKEALHISQQKNLKRFVPSFQLDAHLVGQFLNELGKKSVLYGYFGKSQRNPKTRKDGIPYPCMDTPTNIFFSGNRRTGKDHVTVHSWVLQHYGIQLEPGQDCHHIDGDITNNMRENLEVLSSKDHGYLTMQEQIHKGNIHRRPRSRALTDQQVIQIRAQYQLGQTSFPQLAKIYSVSPLSIYKAVHGLEAYKDITKLL